MELDNIMLDKDLEKELVYSILEENYENENEKNIKPKRRKHYSSKKAKKKIKSELRIRTVLFLLLTLIANTYAWFIYNSTVSSQIQVHIKSWHFELEAGDISNDFIFRVAEAYPGMPTETTTINATNSGETDATVTCKITYVKIFDQEYFAEPENEEDKVEGVTYYSSEDLLDMILNDYPFKIGIYIDDTLYDGTTEVIIPSGETSTTIEYKVDWPYETGTTANEISAGDIVDTEWGERAYDYYENKSVSGPTDDGYYGIQVNVKIIATQSNSSGTEPEPEP